MEIVYKSVIKCTDSICQPLIVTEQYKALLYRAVHYNNILNIPSSF